MLVEVIATYALIIPNALHVKLPIIFLLIHATYVRLDAHRAILILFVYRVLQAISCLVFATNVLRDAQYVLIQLAVIHVRLATILMIPYAHYASQGVPHAQQELLVSLVKLDISLTLRNYVFIVEIIALFVTLKQHVKPVALDIILILVYAKYAQLAAQRAR